MAGKQQHRSTVKQVNKKHNLLGHKTKRYMKNLLNGRTESVISITKKAKHDLGRKERRNQQKVIRSNKRQKAMEEKRKLGTSIESPFLVSIVMLNPEINPRIVVSALSAADPNATVTTNQRGNTHISSSLYKQRFTIVVPPINDLYAILDAAKVSSIVLFVWPSCERGADAVLDEEQEQILSGIKAQGLPTAVHACVGFADMPQKRKAGGYQTLLSEVNHYFPGHDKAKVFMLDKPGEPLLCLRQLGAQKQRKLYFRDHRPHLMAENVDFHNNEGTGSSGTMAVSGYLRGVPLSPNMWVHLPGWGDYKVSQIVAHGNDPHPLVIKGRTRDSTGRDDDQLLVPDGDQEDFSSTTEENSDEDDLSEDGESDENSPLETGSITSVPVVPKIVPNFMKNPYMASWYQEGVDYGVSDSEEEDEAEMTVPPAEDDTASSMAGDDDDRMSVTSESDTSVNDEGYDDKVDYDQEMDEYARMQASRDELEFPDELDTPRDIPARERFQRYKPMKSFKNSEWNLSENLPSEYKKIFNIPEFERFRKTVMKSVDRIEGAIPGDYVTVYIKDVPKHLYTEQLQTGSSFVLFGLLINEQCMSLANYAIKSHPTGHVREFKSKDRLIFHVGFRRFVNRPIFSEHTNGDKQKFCRFFRPGMTVVASMYAPITYPPASVLVFHQKGNGKQDLIATGSVYNFNSNRCVLKRVILSGHPFKIHKKTVVVRYMFFDKHDINWFKEVELRTKYGRRGEIKEPLGTHGHMKCKFDDTLKSEDTILLTLYKRVYPKWCYDSYAPRPLLYYTPASYAKHSSDGEASEGEEEEEPQQNIKSGIDRMMMPPPPKIPKRVHFS